MKTFLQTNIFSEWHNPILYDANKVKHLLVDGLPHVISIDWEEPMYAVKNAKVITANELQTHYNKSRKEYYNSKNPITGKSHLEYYRQKHPENTVFLTILNEL